MLAGRASQHASSRRNRPDSGSIDGCPLRLSSDPDDSVRYDSVGGDTTHRARHYNSANMIHYKG
jgi:hypothetical protein